MNRPLLHAFFEGKATEKEKEAIKHWLNESEHHREILLKEREFFDAILLVGPPDERTSERIRHPRFVRKLLRVAAVAALLFLSGYYFHSHRMKQLQQMKHVVSVSDGQRANIKLPDGTNVWINARSRISYPSCFSGGTRDVTLEGEAWFEVKSDIRKPFIVHTDKYDIRALGTIFNVEAYPDSEHFAAGLIEGCIEVKRRFRQEQLVSLMPDHQAVEQNGRLVVTPITDYDIYRWRDGLICFKETDFITLTKRLEKYYGIRIVLETDQPTEKIFSGKLRVLDGIDNALRLLQKEGQYTFTHDIEKNVIHIK
ncbi:MAG: FecR family protein [Tannerella sp.]|nr:FecR family protein [Tannerella sp.]